MQLPVTAAVVPADVAVYLRHKFFVASELLAEAKLEISKHPTAGISVLINGSFVQDSGHTYKK